MSNPKVNRDERDLNHEVYLEKNGLTHRRVNDPCSQAVLEDILEELGGVGGDAFYAQTQTITTPGVLQTLISVTVPALTTRRLTRVVVTCRQSVQYEIKIDALVVGSGRTGSGHSDSFFIFDPKRTAITGSVIKVESLAKGPASDIEAYLMAVD